MAFHFLFTRRRITEEALKRSEAEFRSLADNAVTGILRFDRNGNILYANTAATRIFGYANSAELIANGIPAHIAIPGEFNRQIYMLDQDGTIDNLEIEIITAQGASRLILLSESLVGDVISASFSDITDRYRETRELRKLSGIIERIADTVVITDPEGTIEYVNPAFELMTGYTSAETLGQKLSMLKSGKHDDAFYQRLWATIKKGSVFHDVFTNRKKNGSLFYEDKTITPIVDDVGKIINFVATGKDITERRETADALEKTKRGLELAQSIARCGSWELDLATGKGLWSKELFVLFHRDPSLGEPPFDEFLADLHREDRNLFVERMNQSVYTGMSLEIDFRTNPDNGPVEYFRTTFMPILDTTGTLVNMTGTTLDITAVKTIQNELETLNRTLEERVEERTEELVRSEETYRALFDFSQEGILLTTTDGKIVRANRKAIALLGFTKEDYDSFGEFGFRSFAPHKPDIETAVHFAAAVRGEDVPLFEDTFITKDGEQIDVEISLSTVRNDDGSISLVQAIFRDIKERKRAENLLRESYERISEANESLEKASRMKDEFLANMSHEIRTPMNAIIGLSALALKTDLSDKQRDYIEKVHSSGIALLGIINDILDFSKIEAGKLRLEQVDFNLEGVIANVSSMIAEKLEEKDLEFLVHFPAEIPRLWSGDPLRITQVLLNLVSNAVKFTARGEIDLEVSIDGSEGDKARFRFTVRDTGIGMSDDELRGLFRPFTQADSSTTRKYGGTGLGLSISRRLVGMMGGDISARSEKGKGSEFSFSVLVGKASSDDAHTEGLADARDIPSDIEGCRVLVVGGLPSARDILRDILTELRFRTDVAETIGEASRIFAKEDSDDRYRILFVDHRKMSADGVSIATRLKIMANDEKSPAIFVVTRNPEEEFAIIESGANACLVKPLTISKVGAAIRKYFNAAPPVQIKKKDSEHDRCFADKRVLVVDDNELNRQIANELLVSYGATVISASDGKEAVTAVTKGDVAFDIVLMDIQMPVMDGYEAARRIRDDGRFSSLPIVAMTAYAMESDKKRVIDAGMNDHISKPIDPANLRDTLIRVSGKHRDMPRVESGRSPEKQPLIDFAGALERVNGNKDLFLSLLRKFAESQKDIPEKIRNALDSGDLELATRLAHTLKGVSGNLGAALLYTDATQLEDCLRKNEPREDNLTILEQHMKETLVEISGMVTETTSRKKKRKISAVQKTETSSKITLQTLSELIEAYDTEAVDFVNQNQEEIICLLGRENYELLERSLDAYNFSEALRCL
jgi:PAS domain S-box-containing protein